MSSVVIAGDASGTVTLQAPSAAGSTVVTLPSSSMNMGNGGGNVSTNTAFGASALAANVNGYGNVALGYQALKANTDGDGNVGVGRDSLATNTTGISNIGVGRDSLAVNTTGSYNIAVGRQALQANTTASNNTAVGYQAGYSNTTGTSVTALGAQAGYNNTTGNWNVFVGVQAGFLNTTGAGNTFVGEYAGYNTTGSANTFIGNTSTGFGSGYAVTTGSKNTIIGGYSGNQGGLDIRTASNYIVLSDGDGNPRCYWDNIGAMTTAGGVNAIPSTTTFPALFHGQNAGGDFYAGIDNSTGGVFGNGNYVRNIYSSGSYRIYVTASSAGVYLAPAGTSWTSASDERFKTDLLPIENATNKVASLRAVTGRFKTDEEGTSRSFLIAQDVLAVFPEAVDASDPDKLGVQYSDMIPLLVASIKELNAKVDAQAAEIAALKGQA